MTENTVKILDIKISTLDNQKIRNQVYKYLKGRQRHQIVTPNPEFLLSSLKDDEFYYILNNASLSVPDGIGLKFASWLNGGNIKRMAGSDLMQDILAYAHSDNMPVAVLNWSKGLSSNQEISNAIKNKYPKIKLLIQSAERDKDIDLDKIKKFAPAVLLCSLGAPYQDKVIFKLLPQLPSARLGMGIGGSFDFMTGKLRRAPVLMRSLGLEWIWRLILQPRKRFKRIYNAFIIFSWTVFKVKYINRFFYRKNVIGFLFKDKQVLILNSNKVDEDYWGLPQGGIDKGESEINTIKREIKEETNTDNFKILKQYNNIYKYDWPKNYGIMGYRGQKQTLFILKYFGKKDDIKISLEHKDFRWVDINKLIDEADPIHRGSYELFVQKYYNNKYV
ncbi:MAG: WecB/TagA/CpsF family glycosyltransferase [bacterium]